MTQTSLQKRGSQYDEEKVNGTRTSTKKPSKLLVIGGPAEGKMLEETEYNSVQFAEIKPVNFRMFEKDLIDDPQDAGYVTHVYNIQKLAYKDEDGRLWQKKVYLHSSLTLNAGLVRLKDFLMKQFIMMEM